MSTRTPGYRLHKPSGLARVRLNGRDIYLGRYGTPESRAEYDRVIAEWLAGGRYRVPANECPRMAVVQLVAAYTAHCRDYYQQGGEPTSQLRTVLRALTFLSDLHGETLLTDFGPLAFKAVRQVIVEAGVCRGTANDYGAKIKACFRWGVANELCPPNVYEALRTVAGLGKGRTPAPDRPAVLPVTLDVYEATLPHLPPRQADILRVARLTGCRPGEAASLRGDEIDTSGEVWICRPAAHKTAWRGKGKTFAIGPRAQMILLPYLMRSGGGWLFPGSRRGKPILENTICREVRRQCEKHGIPHWSPGQLRHLRATEVRARWGIEAAQRVLGHEDTKTTEIYALANLDTAKEVMREIG